MAARYTAAALPTLRFARTIRLGIVRVFSAALELEIRSRDGSHSSTRNRFHVSGYYTSGERDRETDAAAALCDRFVQGPRSLDRWRRMILDDAAACADFPEIAWTSCRRNCASGSLRFSMPPPGASRHQRVFRPSILHQHDLMEPAEAAATIPNDCSGCRKLIDLLRTADIQPVAINGRNSACAKRRGLWCVSHCQNTCRNSTTVFHRIVASSRLSALMLYFESRRGLPPDVGLVDKG